VPRPTRRRSEPCAPQARCVPFHGRPRTPRPPRRPPQEEPARRPPHEEPARRPPQAAGRPAPASHCAPARRTRGASTQSRRTTACACRAAASTAARGRWLPARRASTAPRRRRASPTTSTAARCRCSATWCTSTSTPSAGRASAPWGRPATRWPRARSWRGTRPPSRRPGRSAGRLLAGRRPRRGQEARA